MPKYLITIQAYVEATDATTAENIAIDGADYLVEVPEGPNTCDGIQTCVVEKAPFRPLGPRFWAGASCEAEIAART